MKNDDIKDICEALRVASKYCARFRREIKKRDDLSDAQVEDVSFNAWRILEDIKHIEKTLKSPDF